MGSGKEFTTDRDGNNVQEGDVDGVTKTRKKKISDTLERVIHQQAFT